MNINAYTSRPRLLIYQTIVSVTPQEVEQQDLAPAERFGVWPRDFGVSHAESMQLQERVTVQSS